MNKKLCFHHLILKLNILHFHVLFLKNFFFLGNLTGNIVKKYFLFDISFSIFKTFFINKFELKYSLFFDKIFEIINSIESVFKFMSEIEIEFSKGVAFYKKLKDLQKSENYLLKTKELVNSKMIIILK